MTMAKHFSFLLLIAGFLAFYTLPANALEDSQQKLARAKNMIDKGKAKPAATLLREIIRSNPNNAEAHMQLGAALAALADDDNYDKAIAEEELAIKLDPKSYHAHRILGMIYANQRKTEQSISSLKEACRLNPSSFASFRDLSKAYISAGKNDEAIAALKKAIEIKPDNLDVQLKLSMLIAKKGNYPEAIEVAQRAAKLGGENKAEPHLVLANLKLESGDSEGAIPEFKTAIAANGYDSLGCKNPLTMASSLSGLGWAIASDESAKDKDVSKEKLQEAYLYQKKAIKAYPSYLTAYIRSADLLGRQGKSKEADNMYQNLIKGTDYNAVVATSYASFLKNAERKEEAKTVLKKALEKAPENKEAAEALAALEQLKTK